MERTPGQTTSSRANLDSSPNGPFCVMDRNKRADYTLSVLGQHLNVEKEMMEVSSPIKPKASPTNTKVYFEDSLSLKGEGSGKAKCHWKKIAREKGENKSPTSEVQTQILGAKRAGKIIFAEEEAPTQKKLCSKLPSS